ncbi:hypothetical protein M1N00_02390 [Thermodesulfovibrionales bacterium]|nr:hypothetical protein [Thermodesulfovibrionales bacterium]MCL0035491.1 hypothetical protein [Thermodesulfovibrionales bacterium]
MSSEIKRNFNEVIKKIKWFFVLLSERVRIEIAVFGLRYKPEELKKQKDELFRRIGERVYEMRDKDGRDIYASKEIIDAFEKLGSLETEIKETREKASEVSKTTA